MIAVPTVLVAFKWQAKSNRYQRVARFVDYLSLPQTQSDQQLTENRRCSLRDERSCQAHWLDGRRSIPVAGSARGPPMLRPIGDDGIDLGIGK
jgi:hypothetical protein